MKCSMTAETCLIIPDSPWAIDPLRSHPALGPLYISAWLKSRGHGVDVLDLTGTSRNGHGLSDYEISAKTIGVSAVTPQYPLAVSIMNELKERGIGEKYVVGGPHATGMGPALLQEGWDYVVAGEGEVAMEMIVGGKRKPGVIVEPAICRLDSIPFPDRDAVDVSRYKYERGGVRYTSILGSRGCAWGRCVFCCQTWPRPVRYRSPQNIVEEATMLKERHGYGGLYFYDDELNLNRPWLSEMCRLIAPLEMAWRCLIRADVTQEQVREMKEAGCVEVFIGVESGSARILNIIRKGITPGMAHRAVKLCADAGMHVRVGLMIGLPGEDEASLAATRSWLFDAKKAVPDMDFDLTLCVVYPGSAIWAHPERYDIVFNATDPSRMIYKRPAGQYEGITSTSRLSSERILEVQGLMEEEFGSWGVKLEDEKKGRGVK